MIAGRLGACALFLGLLFAESAWPQLALPGSGPSPAKPETSEDPLGRNTPRGTVRGFLAACTKEDDQTAVRYLNTPQRGKTAVALAHELFEVLNNRLSGRLNEISDKPDGSLAFPAEPDKDLVGTISSDNGDVDIVLERVERTNRDSVWLFSQKTLDAIPRLYAEIHVETGENGIIKFLLEIKFAHVALIHWLAVFVGFPLFYFIGAALNRLAGGLLRRLRKNPDLTDPEFLSVPVRLLLVAFLIRWMLSAITLPILAREFWSAIEALSAISGCVWLLVRLTGWSEGKLRIRLDRRNLTGALSISRFARSAIDALITFVGLLVLLHYFGLNPTTVLAGLGVGGIAVALAAQKTLENVIAGVSLISDKAIRVGDLLKVGDTLGHVSDIGLRSTRIRTFDRTVVNLPNGQIANASLENLSLRDQFWFHQFVGLPYATNAAQIRSILEGVRDLLDQRPDVNKNLGWVRLLRFGVSCFDLEIFAYVVAPDWREFLKVQEELLLQVMDVVQAAGAQIALPSQTIFLTASQGKAPAESLQAISAGLPGRVSHHSLGF